MLRLSSPASVYAPSPAAVFCSRLRGGWVPFLFRPALSSLFLALGGCLCVFLCCSCQWFRFCGCVRSVPAFLPGASLLGRLGCFRARVRAAFASPSAFGVSCFACSLPGGWFAGFGSVCAVAGRCGWVFGFSFCCSCGCAGGGCCGWCPSLPGLRGLCSRR
jgi:hypothetical protein